MEGLSTAAGLLPDEDMEEEGEMEEEGADDASASAAPDPLRLDRARTMMDAIMAGDAEALALVLDTLTKG